MTERLILFPEMGKEIHAILWEEGRPLEWLVAAEEAHLREPARGDVFLGVCNGEDPGLSALFVDIGAAQAAMLPLGAGQRAARPGTRLAVQIRRASREVGKGAVVATQIRLPGRWAVAVPDGRPIRRSLTRSWPTAQAEAWAAREERSLLARWRDLHSGFHAGAAPRLVWPFGDPVSVALREWGETQIWVEGLAQYDAVCARATPGLPSPQVRLWVSSARGLMSDVYALASAQAAMQSPRVPLPGGGYLLIESTHALTAVDVNSGQARAADREALAAQTNSEAVREVARQLRLRNLRGIILVDLLRTGEAEHERLAQIFTAATSGDRGHVRVSGFTPTGLMEITRGGH